MAAETTHIESTPDVDDAAAIGPDALQPLHPSVIGSALILMPSQITVINALDPEEDDQADDVVMLYGLSLDEDEDTSMALSVRLHLMSEHHLPAALHMSDEEAERVHRREHALHRHSHVIADHRFRVRRALAGMFLSQQRATPGVPAQHARA